MKIPQGVNLVHDEAARKAYVTIDDRSIATQRAMWGMPSQSSYINHPPTTN